MISLQVETHSSQIAVSSPDISNRMSTSAAGFLHHEQVASGADPVSSIDGGVTTIPISALKFLNQLEDPKTRMRHDKDPIAGASGDHSTADVS